MSLFENVGLQNVGLLSQGQKKITEIFLAFSPHLDNIFGQRNLMQEYRGGRYRK
jgi:hypothetical protein